MKLLTYTDHNKVAGIYFIVASNGSTYVGQSYNLYMRMHQHLNKLKEKHHDNKHLQSIYNKYKEGCLTFYVLRTLTQETRDRYTKKQVEKMLTPMEQVYFTLYEPDINKHKWAFSALGTKRSQEFRDACKIRYTGRKASPETLEKMRINATGKKQTPEHVAKRNEYFIKDYVIYHKDEGLIEGRNLNELARKHKCYATNLLSVIKGEYYTSNGFYKSEEYFLDKNRWLEDYPVPKSDYPTVSWHRKAKKWFSIFKKKGYKEKRFFHRDDYTAYMMAQEYRASLGLDEAC